MKQRSNGIKGSLTMAMLMSFVEGSGFPDFGPAYEPKLQSPEDIALREKCEAELQAKAEAKRQRKLAKNKAALCLEK